MFQVKITAINTRKMASKYKARNEVNVMEDSRGYLQYQIPSCYALQIYGKKQKYISVGCKNTSDSLLEAKAKLLELRKDLENGKFNPADVSKYKCSNKKVKEYRRYEAREVTATELFNDYQHHRFANQNNGVGLENYKSFFNAIKKSPCQDVLTTKGQTEIADYLCAKSGYKIVKNVLAIMDKAIKRGIDKGTLPQNTPNIFIKRKLEYLNNNKQERKQYPLMLTKRGYFRDHNKIAWNKKEMGIIIKAFRDRHKWSIYYKKCDIKCLLIEFLFYTGVRHGEAYGLKWGALTDDFSGATIREAFSSGVRVQKSTKNQKIRKIELSPSAQNILIRVRDFYKCMGIGTKNNDYVFVKENGKPFVNADFNMLWRGQSGSKKVKEKIGIVTQLFLDKKLPVYMEMYSTRRTYASLMAQGAFLPKEKRNPDPATVAEYIGDNIQTVIDHYYAGQEDYRPPAFDFT